MLHYHFKCFIDFSVYWLHLVNTPFSRVLFYYFGHLNTFLELKKSFKYTKTIRHIERTRKILCAQKNYFYLRVNQIQNLGPKIKRLPNSSILSLRILRELLPLVYVSGRLSAYWTNSYLSLVKILRNVKYETSYWLHCSYKTLFDLSFENFVQSDWSITTSLETGRTFCRIIECKQMTK